MAHAAAKLDEVIKIEFAGREVCGARSISGFAAHSLFLLGRRVAP